MRIIRSIALGLGTALAATKHGRQMGGRPPQGAAPKLVVVPRPTEAKPRAGVNLPAGKVSWLHLGKRSVSQFFEDDCLTMGAALAYYTTFSIAPLLLIVISLAGLFLGRGVVLTKLMEQITGLVGAEAAQQITTMLQNANGDRAGVVGAILGFVFVLVGATGAFAQLQEALNRAWGIVPDREKKNALKAFILKRMLSLGMILGIGFLLLVSLLMGAALAGLNAWFADSWPAWFSAQFIRLLEMTISLALITVLFAAIFRVLPDTYIPWCDVWVGAGLTALLFTVGKVLIGFYLGKSSMASAYGAAGSFVVILVWTYYSSLIVLMGAEFTQVWVERRGNVSLCRDDASRPGSQNAVSFTL